MKDNKRIYWDKTTQHGVMGQSPARICEILWWVGDSGGGLRVTKIWDYSIAKSSMIPKLYLFIHLGLGYGEDWG